MKVWYLTGALCGTAAILASLFHILTESGHSAGWYWILCAACFVAAFHFENYRRVQ